MVATIADTDKAPEAEVTIRAGNTTYKWHGDREALTMFRIDSKMVIMIPAGAFAPTEQRKEV